MKENKNIDQFFKDKFEDFDVNPPEQIWQNIEEKLQKKKKRRLIPFWWYGSGVAALFIIGLFVFNNFYTLEIHPVNDVVIENNNSAEIDSETNISNDTKDDVKEIPAVVTTESNSISADKKTKTATENVYDDNSVGDKNKSVVSTDDNQKLSSGKNKTATDNANRKKQNAVADSNSTLVSAENNRSESGVRKNKKSKIRNNSVINSNNSVAENANSTKNRTNNNAKNAVISSSKKTEKIAENGNTIAENKENIVQNGVVLEENKAAINKENNIDLGRIAMKNQDNVATKGEVNPSKDSTAIATVELNALEELLKEKENSVAPNVKMNRWQVTPNLAPIYFGSFENGSPLDSNLDDNTKNFNNNLSYGVAVNYSVNKKLKLRTGVNSFSVDYNTNDIMFFQSSDARMMKNIDPTIKGSIIQIVPLKNVNPFFNRNEVEQNTGILNQKMGYIEMPVELSYQLLNKKLGIEIIGGMSTMFLNKNEIYLEAEGMNMKIGEASNLNPVHFSTNIGVGLNYGFLKKFQARIEPTFKYQINTFSRDSQNFKPYIFGIYSGISYNF